MKPNGKQKYCQFQIVNLDGIESSQPTTECEQRTKLNIDLLSQLWDSLKMSIDIATAIIDYRPNQFLETLYLKEYLIN